jgi:hypothetical protein
MSESIDFGVDYTMVLEYLTEQYPFYNTKDIEFIELPQETPVIITSPKIYSKSQNSQLESKNQNFVTKSTYMIRKMALQFTSR